MVEQKLEDALVFHARRYSTALQSENARSNYLLRLQIMTDPDFVLGLAQQFSLTPEVAIPAWLRVVQLAEGNAEMGLLAAGGLYAQGLDEFAQQVVEGVLAADPGNIAALELKAALTPDPQQRRIIFEQILKIEPGNRTAVHNLILLDRPL